MRTALALAASAALGAFGAWLVLADAYPHEGPWVEISPRHGIHVGDVIIVLLWAAATWAMLRRARHRPRVR
ncbi:hypothetical protein [Amnibacterium endophyticum]|uniref:Uncharacterized protein n=1 Tax=Amnibacterium endophyticum TaxID=2109337 RepID=A0ABW4LCN3_9MICO